MSISRLIPLFVLLPILAFADSDRNFKVPAEFVKIGEVVTIAPEMAIEASSGNLVAQKQVFPLNASTLYLRHKKGPKEYQWVYGSVNTANYKKLHAFSLKQNHLKVMDVVSLRFYATQKAKAFQDEPDIYFDKEYIYSPRVPKLFFIKNGRWQQLNETSLPGVVALKKKDTTMTVAAINKPLTFVNNKAFPVEPGSLVYSVSAKNCLSYDDIAVVKAGEALVLDPTLYCLDSASTKQVTLSVTMPMVAATKTLEETEAVYDRFVYDLQTMVDIADTAEFEKLYLKKKFAEAVDLTADDEGYMLYAKQFDIKRMDAQKEWRNSKMLGVSEIDGALRKKLDSLQALPFRGMMMPSLIMANYDTLPSLQDSLQTVAPAATTASSATAAKDSAVADSAAAPAAPVLQMKSLNLKFGVDGGRYDVVWTGTIIGVPVDSIYAWFAAQRADMKVYFTLQNNKPVWVYKGEVVPGRYHYRYTQLEVEVAGQLYQGQGKFILPEHVLKEVEVQEWLNPKPVVEEKVEAPAPTTDSVKAEVPVTKDGILKVIRDKMRGELALIDSGSFRYYGKVVNMSPFAIMTTEMTQEIFAQLMTVIEDTTKRIVDKSSFKDPKKPVHNINWNQAREVCQMLEGDLPTEAQWEFAGRADNLDGAAWHMDKPQDPGVYAVYKENSYKLGKKNEAYGPQKVGSKKPNAWGLYDMSGNVAEWTRDKYFMFSFNVESSNPTGAMFGSNKIYKGGSWKDKEKMLNLTEQDDEDPRYWSDAIGFRCVFPRSLFEKK